MSCGGKTLLCQRIAERYPSVTVFNMDSYYLWPDVNMQLQYPVEYSGNYANFEVVSAVNFDQLQQELDDKLNEIKKSSSTSQNHPIVLVEGILVLGFRQLQKYFMKRYFLTLPKDLAEERRQQRSYDPPDPAGYFGKFVWPYYIQHKESLAEMTDIIYLDGSLEIGVNLEKVCQDLDHISTSQKSV